MLQQMDSDAWSWLFKRMPEQEFLTLHFQGKRYNLRVEYNFQTKQIVFTNRKGLECCRWLAQKMTQQKETSRLANTVAAATMQESRKSESRWLIRILRKGWHGLRRTSWWLEIILALAKQRVATDARLQGKRRHRVDGVHYTFQGWVEYADSERLQRTCPVVEASV